MKNLIQYILIGFFGIIAFSCSTDFLSEETNLPAINSEIIIYPGDEAKGYFIYVEVANAAGFEVLEAPDWLNVQTVAGLFTNNVAIITCSASFQSNFSETGIYKSFLLLNIDGLGQVKVPVSYITKGYPGINVERDLYFQHDDNYPYDIKTIPLVIRNEGEGILIWKIAEKSEFISIQEIVTSPLPMDFSVFSTPPYGETVLHLSHNSQYPISEDLYGKIKIVTNDDNNIETEINVQYDLGDPSFLCYTVQLDFGQTEVTQSIEIFNTGTGLLKWRIDACPEWLSISETNGALLPATSQILVFTCDRSLLPEEGHQSHSIYFETNDRENPSQAMTVLVENIIQPENPDPE